MFGGLRPRMRCWTCAAAIFVSATLLTLSLRRLEWTAFWSALQGANPLGLLLAWGIFGASLFFASWRWHLMLRIGGNAVHPGASVRSALIGHCAHTFLFGAMGGDVAKAWIYARWHQLKSAEVLVAAPLDRLMALVGAIAFGLLTLGLGIFSGGFEPLCDDRSLLLPAVWILGVTGIAVLTAPAVFRWSGTRFQSLDSFRKTLRQNAAKLLRDKSALFQSGLAAFGVHACLSFTMAVCLASVSDAEIPWLEALWLFPVISMISGLSIGVGGAGWREGSALVLLGFFGIPAEDAVAAALFNLIIGFAWCAVGFAIWRRGEAQLMMAKSKTLPRTISVVIPTWNEADSLAATVRSAKCLPEVKEILLADSGSEDRTLEIGRLLGCRVFQTMKGRGIQMREAARRASGDVVLLLHADTVLPKDGGRLLLNVFRDQRVVGGGFWKRFDRPSVWTWGSRFRCLIRLYPGGLVLGDQAMFIRRTVLETLGGVPPLPLMEEFELCRRLNQTGRLALADGTVVTSARKFRQLGAWKTYWLMWRVTFGYYLGTPVHKLAEIYSRK